ncbi:HAD family phosphatase [Sphingomonas sp. HITSZ_GF]|uniref:HAD family hydrolase n=1 Tax=Sphingomonas sp. HITSZ_GF TaxID=3037247 RepID=UPI00240DD983|nr:HAD family phosphatase [Sphingomonas sp. HITSZ_GF]MDG2534628.1 HAD family phosphatase [Sphingomonas sp. HITSZ_GF]
MPHAVIFDVGNVLFPWNPRSLYGRLIDDDRALDAFMADVLTMEWHTELDRGRPFAEASAELAAAYPEHADLIAAWGPRFNETLGPPIAGMAEILADLDSRGVPLFAITNFSGEFFRAFAPLHPGIFGRFRDIVVSGDEKLLKPDRAIYDLALRRFGLEGPDAVFIDDSIKNVAGAQDAGIHALLFTDAAKLRVDLEGLGLL